VISHNLHCRKADRGHGPNQRKAEEVSFLYFRVFGTQCFRISEVFQLFRACMSKLKLLQFGLWLRFHVRSKALGPGKSTVRGGLRGKGRFSVGGWQRRLGTLILYPCSWMRRSTAGDDNLIFARHTVAVIVALVMARRDDHCHLCLSSN